jgi:hypothetical protein
MKAEWQPDSHVSAASHSTNSRNAAKARACECTHLMHGRGQEILFEQNHDRIM